MTAARRATDEPKRLAGGDVELLADEVDAGQELADRMLDLQTAVELDEVEAPDPAQQELERAGVAVADRTARRFGGRLHRLARVVVERRRGDSSISFWWRRWIEHSRSRASARSRRRRRDLDLDVPRRRTAFSTYSAPSPNAA